MEQFLNLYSYPYILVYPSEMPYVILLTLKLVQSSWSFIQAKKIEAELATTKNGMV